MVQGRQSLQRGHLFKVEEGGIPGAEQNTPSENGGSAPGNRPCGEFVVVPRTPPPFWSRAGLFLGKLITVQLQSIGAVHGIWDTGSREWGYRLWASGGARLLSNLLPCSFRKNHFSEALVNQSGSWDSGYWVMGGNILGHGI